MRSIGKKISTIQSILHTIQYGNFYKDWQVELNLTKHPSIRVHKSGIQSKQTKPMFWHTRRHFVLYRAQFAPIQSVKMVYQWKCDWMGYSLIITCISLLSSLVCVALQVDTSWVEMSWINYSFIGILKHNYKVNTYLFW